MVKIAVSRLNCPHSGGLRPFRKRPFPVGVLVVFVALLASTAPTASGASILEAIDRVQPRMVKIYGAGGFRNMEAYQSGMLISPEGHILTVFSYVLDTPYTTAVLADGRKFEAQLLGADPRLDVAVLKIDTAGAPYFDLRTATTADAGTRVLAFSNLFGVATGNEPASVQQGTVSVVTRLEARRGASETPYRGPVYVLDMTTNNPGAAGGALVTRQGELLGMLGKELRNTLNNTWLNYAVAAEELRPSVDRIAAGRFVARRDTEDDAKPARSLELASLGLVLIPDVLARTPPYVDHVRPDSPAAKAGIRPDDLILLLNDRLIQSCKDLASDLQYVDYQDPVTLTVLRGQDLVKVSLQPAGDAKTPRRKQP